MPVTVVPTSLATVAIDTFMTDESSVIRNCPAASVSRTTDAPAARDDGVALSATVTPKTAVSSRRPRTRLSPTRHARSSPAQGEPLQKGLAGGPTPARPQAHLTR